MKNRLPLYAGAVLAIGVFTSATLWPQDKAPTANEQLERGKYLVTVMSCNDCHTPHDVIGKYATKVRNGFWHSFYFTTGAFHEPIHILARDRAITEGACRRCHEEVVQAMGTPAHAGSDQLSCIRCHSSVGHQELAAVSLPFPE